jgi:hypothetical protein
MPYCCGRCDLATQYKNYYYYTVYLTEPEKTPADFHLVLTGNRHSLYGGKPSKRTCNEPIIRFEPYQQPNRDPQLAFVQYQDFLDAINSDQPAHSVRVRSGDRYITLSKIFVRAFRNGQAGQALNKITQPTHL